MLAIVFPSMEESFRSTAALPFCCLWNSFILWLKNYKSIKSINEVNEVNERMHACMNRYRFVILEVDDERSRKAITFTFPFTFCSHTCIVLPTVTFSREEIFVPNRPTYR